MDQATFHLGGEPGPLSAELTNPGTPRAVLVLAHGAGAGYRHANLLAVSEALAARRVATLRFNFPFMEAGRRRVDARPVAVEAIGRAAGAAAERLPGIPLLVGGHSFGGRMASHAVAQSAVACRALICLSFPLHPAGRPGTGRAAHLDAVSCPVLFLSGTRDRLAEPELLSEVVRGLGHRARLHWLDDADHGYRVRKNTRRDPRSVFDEIGDEIERFLNDL
ncbi:MAG: alpha/beta family hydrolase [Pseudomonadota bacterium]